MVISNKQCEVTLKRMQALLEKRYPQAVNLPEWEGFSIRLKETFPTLLNEMLVIYGHHFDFYYHLERLLEIMADA